MEVRKVAHEAEEVTDVGSLVQQVLVEQLLRLDVSQSLLILSDALTVAVDLSILHHFALSATQILDLVACNSAVNQV